MAYIIGGKVRFNVSFDYQGPNYNFAKIRCVVGIGGTWVGFNELCWTETGISLPETFSWERFDQLVIVTLKNVELGKTYDSYVKLMPNIGWQQDIFWHGTQNIQMSGVVAPDTEFANLSVQIG